MGRYILSVHASQLAVFDADIENPFNDWTDIHVAQGFSWREGAVSFRTLQEFGSIDVTFQVAASFALRPNSIRAISVPFRCLGSRGVEVSTIVGGVGEPLLP